MIDEREISDRIHAAFELEPLPGGFERLRIALDSATVKSQPRLRAPLTRGWAPLVAALIVLAIAASALAYALHMRQSAVTNPPRPGAAVLPVGADWAYSANDVAVQLSPPPGAWQRDRGYVLITHDGGRSWVRTPLDLPRINLRWIDSRHIVAAMDDVGPAYEVASTSDGGVTWRITRMPASIVATSNCCNPVQIGTMFFLNDHEGWELCGARFSSCGSNGQQTILYHTLDSGAHWQQLSVVVSSDVVVPLSVSFNDSEHGFMETMSNDTVPRLLVTVDGGKTWRTIQLPAPAATEVTAADCGGVNCVIDLEMFGARGVLTVIGLSRDPYTVTTNDGGVTWGSPHTIPFAPPALMPTPWLYVQDPDSWWAVDAPGSLYRTNDAGSSWRRIATSLPDGYILDSVGGGQNGVLWGVTRYAGAGQYPLRSTDDGATWSVVKLPT